MSDARECNPRYLAVKSVNTQDTSKFSLSNKEPMRAAYVVRTKQTSQRFRVVTQVRSGVVVDAMRRQGYGATNVLWARGVQDHGAS
jgi:hypothetical protein